MKRPLCSVCLAFVVCVFVYLFAGLLPAVQVDETDGSRVTLTGELYNKEYKNDSLVLYLRHVKKIDNRSGAGIASKEQNIVEYENDISVMCYLDGSASICYEEPKIGAWLCIAGEVSLFDEAANPGEFDAVSYYRTLGIYYRLYDADIIAGGEAYSVYREGLYRLRRYFGSIYDSLLSEKAAATLKAMALGDRSELDAKSKTLFQRSGISHILAISGLHITFIGMMAYGLLKKLRLPRVLSAAFCVAFIIAYGDMTGMSGSAYRAVFMFGMKLLAEALGRTYDMMTALSLAAVLLLFSQPLYIRQPGFLLSFGAILGIGLFSDMMKPGLSLKNNARIANKLIIRPVEALTGSLSIFLVHFPIILCTYYEFPIYSFLLNLIIIPAMSLLLAAGLLCLLCGSIGGVLSVAAKLAGLFCEALLAGFEYASAFSLKLPFAQWITGKPPAWKTAVFYAAVLSLWLMQMYAVRASGEKRAHALNMRIGVPYWCKLIVIVLAAGLLSHREYYDTCVTFLDVGQGDGIWVESASGRHYLIDCGSTSKSALGEYTLLPFLKYMGNSRLDAVFLTHLDEDHISGVRELLEEYENGSGASGVQIDRIILSAAVIEDEAYYELKALCGQKGIPVLYAAAGDVIGDEELYFEVLHPDGAYTTDSRNAYSLVMRMTVKCKNTDFHALLTGDVEADGEAEVAAYLRENYADAHIELYKAAHHGSKYSNTLDLLELISPTLSVISCGENNSYNHPHAEAVANMEQAGSQIAVTKDCGAIIVHIDNDGWSAERYLKEK